MGSKPGQLQIPACTSEILPVIYKYINRSGLLWLTTIIPKMGINKGVSLKFFLLSLQLKP